MRTAVYPGSFDPVTNGHLDVIKRASRIFDRVIVAVLVNSAKKPAFSVAERTQMLSKVTQGIEGVEIDHFNGLLVDYCKKVGATAIIKGLRAVSDFEYEFQMALTNRQIYDGVDTVFLTTTSEHMYLSSSIVREVARYGGDISKFVPQELTEQICRKLIHEEKMAGSGEVEK